MKKRRRLHPSIDGHRSRNADADGPLACGIPKQPMNETGLSEVTCPSEMPPLPLDRILREAFDGMSWSRCRAWIENGKVSVDNEVVRDNRRLIRGGSAIRVDPAARKPQSHLAQSVRLVYWDSQIVVVDKPSGISTVPFDANEKDTLDEFARRALGKVLGVRLPPLGIVHRIDKETSGVVVFARTTVAKNHLKQQFRFHTNQRTYLALVWGHPRSERIETRIIDDRGDGRRGSTNHPTLGQNAITYVEVVESFTSVSLVRCRLETGRTHQIRIHLSERGYPILGDRVYGNSTLSTSLVVPRLMLHAMELGIIHPTREERLDFRSDLPSDFKRLVQELRSSK
jgi:23S rRNA pseudouridine1911/1915/1917 synthase